MKSLKKAAVGLLLTVLSGPAYGALIPTQQPGPRLIDGSDINKMVTPLNNLLQGNQTQTSVPTLQCGASGSACTFTMFPSTASTGKTTLTMSPNSGNTTTNFNFAAQAAARTITVPDFGASDSLVGLAATQTLTNKTLTAPVTTAISNSGGLTTDSITASGAVTTNGTVDTHGVVFSTALTGNPLVQSHYQVVTAASANAGVVILASATGRTIIPAGPATIMASGTAAGETSTQLICSGGSILETFNSTMLVNNVPIVLNSGGVTLGAAFSSGCPAGQAVLVSNIGTLTTTSNLFVNFPYIVQ